MLYSPPARIRREHDHYETPPELARALLTGLRLAGLELPLPVYDPCLGAGALLRGLGLPGFGSDLFPETYAASPWSLPAPVDASDPAAVAGAIGAARSWVTNPPYGRQAFPIVMAGIELLRAGAVDLVAALLPLPWTAAAGRIGLMNAARLQITCSWRPEWVAGTGGGGKMSSVWLVWTRQIGPPNVVFVGRGQ